MARTLSLLLLTAVLAACGRPGPSETPEETVRTLQELCRNRDFEGVFSLLHPNGLNEAARDFEENTRDDPTWRSRMKLEFDLDEEDLDGLSLRETYALVATRAMETHREGYEKLIAAEIGRVTVNGDEARVRLQMADDGMSIELRRHDGLWYLEEPPEW